MLSKEDRLVFCNQCIHKLESERYGVLCGLTENYPHFQKKCEYFEKSGGPAFSFDKKPELGRLPDVSKKLFGDKAKKSKGSLLGKGIILYVIVKIILQLLKQYHIL